MSARVFVVHTGFVLFFLLALGLLSMARPDLLVVPSDLGRLLLYAVVAFWFLRLCLQPFVFNPVLLPQHGWPGRPVIKIGSILLWAVYVTVYGAALGALGRWAW